jgi:hypothetical protein
MEGILGLHETRERVEQAELAHHQKKNRAALLIIALAVALAIIEMAGKEAQFSSIAYNIEASDLYAFYQAKTIRGTLVRTAMETVDVLTDDPALRADARQKQFSAWKATIDRLDSDPASREGRKELLERAKTVEKDRDHDMQAYHAYEFSAAALQLAIVMASAAIIVEIVMLELTALGFGLVGICLAFVGWLSPSLLQL